MTRALISVIVPIYNVEHYLERCLNSIVNQTYNELEIILVDDGSTDCSGKLCDEWKEKDCRINVMHKKNGGLSSARNAGINACTGEYIVFVDSDDWLALDTYEYCLKLIKEYKADCIQYDYKKMDKEQPVQQRQEIINIYEGKEICRIYMEESTKTGSYSVWRYMYRSDIIDRIRFRDGKINEDIDFNYKVLSRCGKLVISNQYKYFYYQSGNSLSTGGLKLKDFDLYDAANELCKLTDSETYSNIRFLGEVKKARTAFSLLSKIAYYGINDDSIDEKELIKRLVCENRKNILLLIRAPMGLPRKILSLLFAINYRVGCFFVQLMRKMLSYKL